MRQNWQFGMLLRCAGLAAAVGVAQMWSAGAAGAAPVTYDFSGQLNGGLSITGNFTLDGENMLAYDFVLPTTLPFPGPSELVPAPFISHVTLEGPKFQIQTFGDVIVDGGGHVFDYFDVLNLYIDALPTDANPTSLHSISNFEQFDAFSSTQHNYVFVSSSISLPGANATPLPAALPLFATALGGLGLLLGWQRNGKRQAAA